MVTQSDSVIRDSRTGELGQPSEIERDNLDKLRHLQTELLPTFGPSWHMHQNVFIRRQSLSRLIYYYELYKQIVDVPGVICEFGVQWGASLATLINLRGMLEPFNYSRKIYGFDTFEGFAQLDDKDGRQSNKGDYAVSPHYEESLERILHIQESFSPLSHIRKFQLVKGDVCETFPRWLNDNGHAIIAMAILDMDVYKPTRDILKAILPRLTKGSILVFDEVNCPHFPGETEALVEIIGLNNLRLHRFPHQSFCAWAVFGE